MQNLTPQEAPHSPIATDDAPEPGVILIPRATVNYVIIAIVFFVLGGVSSVLFYSRTTEDLIDRTVAEVVAQLPDTVAAEAEPVGLDPNQRYAVTIEDEPAMGAAEPVVTMIEFSDFRCGFCNRFRQETLGPLMEEYGDRVRFVYRDYPVLSPESLPAANASLCANAQGKFWEYHNALFDNQAALGRDLYLSLATDLDLDMEQFTTCVDEVTFRDEIVGDMVDGQALAIRGTPTFFINGRPLVGAQPYESFAAAIEQELAAAVESVPS
jgi:protein-disulfide isomerase